MYGLCVKNVHAMHFIHTIYCTNRMKSNIQILMGDIFVAKKMCKKICGIMALSGNTKSLTYTGFF